MFYSWPRYNCITHLFKNKIFPGYLIVIMIFIELGRDTALVTNLDPTLDVG